MSELAYRDPVPGYPLVYRIDTRTGRDVVFWCRVRKQFLPRLRGHCFYVSDDCDAATRLPPDSHCITLPRPLLLAYQPEFARLSPAEQEVIKRYYITREKGFVRNSKVMESLRSAGLVRSGKLTTRGLNSYLLSP